MTLYKAHAVMPRLAHEREHVVRSYLTIADTWQEAQLKIAEREPRAELITVPGEMPEPLLVDVRALAERECAELRAACAWNEDRLRERRA